MLSFFRKYLKGIAQPRIRYKRIPVSLKLKKLGSDYGGWIIPTQLVNDRSICYLAGAGEDISFDVALATSFQCNVYIFDPTPKSKVHFEALMNAAVEGTTININNNPSTPYKLNKEIKNYLKFYEIGIWKKQATLRFFSPQDDSHVSHSISNLQNTSKYFEAPVERLSDIMRVKQHEYLDILKLDIEGAEYEVIDSLLEDNVCILILCVEFHLLAEGGLELVQSTISKLEKRDYFIVARDELDFTFLNNKFYDSRRNI
jgi:FkbM family methyltransferase